MRTRERSLFLDYCEDVAERRWQQGFVVEELCGALETLNETCLEVLQSDPEATEVGAWFHDHITVTVRFGIDHIQEIYEVLDDRRRRSISSGSESPGR